MATFNCINPECLFSKFFGRKRNVLDAPSLLRRYFNIKNGEAKWLCARSGNTSSRLRSSNSAEARQNSRASAFYTSTANSKRPPGRGCFESHKGLSGRIKDIKHSSARVEDSAERTTRLAADRTILAAERYLAAWARTGLFSLASGGARTLLTGLMPEWLVLADASVLIAPPRV
jgi:hypothetical protein